MEEKAITSLKFVPRRGCRKTLRIGREGPKVFVRVAGATLALAHRFDESGTWVTRGEPFDVGGMRTGVK
jgi:hypothetical protein